MYKAIFFSTLGEYVIEGNFNTKEEAEKYIDNIGSRWIFYPIGFICTDKSIITQYSTKRIKTVVKYLEMMTERAIKNNHADTDIQGLFNEIYFY